MKGETMALKQKHVDLIHEIRMGVVQVGIPVLGLYYVSPEFRELIHNCTESVVETVKKAVNKIKRH